MNGHQTQPVIDSSSSPEVGEYSPQLATDLRSPCPMLNAMANHGYLPRNGRNVTMDQFKHCLTEVLHFTPEFAASLYLGPFLLHADALPDSREEVLPNDEANRPPSEDTQKPTMPFHGAFNIPLNLERQFNFGCRDPHQVNPQGEAVLDLDRLRRHGAIEHDVSLVRRDFAQGDNWSVQPDLLTKLLNSSKDGEILTVADLAHFRNLRLRQQVKDNPKCKFGTLEKYLAFGEISLLLTILGGYGGKGYDQIPKDFLAALMGEERIPYKEGWTRRRLPLSFAEATATSLWAQVDAMMDHLDD